MLVHLRSFESPFLQRSLGSGSKSDFSLEFTDVRILCTYLYVFRESVRIPLSSHIKDLIRSDDHGT